MAVTRELLRQFERMLSPLRVRVANLIARGTVTGVSDGSTLQTLQLGVLADETVDDGERFQSYGFSSVPLSGAEAVIVFPGGNRDHPLVIAVDDRRHRPTGLEAGEVAVYNSAGARILLTKDGDVVVSAASGRKVMVDDGAGGTEPLITKSQFDAHTHPTGVGPSGPPDNAATSGTTVIESK
jgi:phage baseplate assembly protein V